MRRSRPALLTSSKLSTFKLSTSNLLTLVLCILILSTLSSAAAPDRITGPIASGKTVRLGGGIPIQARHGSDEGLVDPSMKMGYVTLLTRPTAAQQKALNKLLADQQNPHSVSYHKWLTPEQYADRFGLSPNDVQKITAWLQSQGFIIVRTAKGRNWIVFSGTAVQVEKTFQTEIHSFRVNGETHFANIAPPMIPVAFSGIVTGLRGLNDFRPKSQLQHIQPGYTFPLNGNTYPFLAPGDVKTIYDINTLYGNGIDGSNQKLVVVGETGIFQSDLTNFRQNFGLSAISCTTTNDVITACNTSNFQYVLVNGSATDIFSDLPEADLDIEWSGATARNAQIIFVTANATNVWDSWYYAVDNQDTLGESVITMSYTAPCELAEADFSAQNPGPGIEGTYLSDEAELAKANSEGITFMSSSGDTGAAECDDFNITGSNTAEFGYAVAYPASSQYVTGVGGTLLPYAEYNSTYFGSSNGSDGGSAKSYIPEQAWNDSLEFAYYCEAGTNKTTDPLCKNNGIGGGPLSTDWTKLQENVIGISAGGGGVSNCVAVDDNGVCTGGFPQPSWQAGLDSSAINPSGLGQASSTITRFSPDVSLAASANFPGYLVCTQISLSGGGSSCDSPTTGITDMLTGCINGTGPCTIYGGTSVSSPIFAGMVALIGEDLVAKGIQTTPDLSNINPILYALAADNSTNGAFNPVTTSSSGVYSNGAWCDAGQPTSGVPADPWPTAMQCPSSGSAFLGFNSYNFDATTNYNLVTGLGSVNASHLAAAIVATGKSATTTAVVSSQNPSSFGAAVTFTATVTTAGSNAPTGTVTFYNGAASLGTGALVNLNATQATATFTTLVSSPLPPGTDSITAAYGGDTNNSASTSAILSQTVNPPTFTFTNTGAASHTGLAGQTTLAYTFLATPTSGATFAGPVTFGCTFAPTDPTLTSSVCSFTPSSIAAGMPATTVTMTVTTAGPNTGTGSQFRRRADNRSPWLPLALPLAGIVMVGFAGRKMSKLSAIVCLSISLVLLGFMVACGSNGPGAVTVTPATAQVPLGGTQQFTASRSTVTWTLSSGAPGTISPTGLYTAPTSGTTPASLTVTATPTSGGAGTAAVTIPAVAVSVQSQPTSVFPNDGADGWPAQTAQFRATVTNAGTNTGVTWAVTTPNAGTIDANGLYTAPTVAGGLPSTVNITATSVADTSKSGPGTETLTPATIPGTYTVTVTATEATVAVPATPAPALVVQ
jgi:subtilase family serine protease